MIYEFTNLRIYEFDCPIEIIHFNPSIRKFVNS
jgi:hypothetical protein